MILPHNAFELGFTGQPMRGEHAIITWRDHEGYLRKFEAPLPDNRDAIIKEQNFTLVYTIQSAGVVRIHLERSDWQFSMQNKMDLILVQGVVKYSWVPMKSFLFV
jgi:hypothetical protein